MLGVERANGSVKVADLDVVEVGDVGRGEGDGGAVAVGVLVGFSVVGIKVVIDAQRPATRAAEPDMDQRSQACLSIAKDGSIAIAWTSYTLHTLAYSLYHSDRDSIGR